MYMFSDGYIDQFGGKNDRKYSAKRFRKLLLNIQDEKMKNQQEILETRIRDWKRENDQIDDILVIGIRV